MRRPVPRALRLGVAVFFTLWSVGCVLVLAGLAATGQAADALSTFSSAIGTVAIMVATVRSWLWVRASGRSSRVLPATIEAPPQTRHRSFVDDSPTPPTRW